MIQCGRSSHGTGAAWKDRQAGRQAQAGRLKQGQAGKKQASHCPPPHNTVIESISSVTALTKIRPLFRTVEIFNGKALATQKNVSAQLNGFQFNQFFFLPTSFWLFVHHVFLSRYCDGWKLLRWYGSYLAFSTHGRSNSSIHGRVWSSIASCNASRTTSGNASSNIESS